jgi:hypothetical protein
VRRVQVKLPTQDISPRAVGGSVNRGTAG